MEEWGEVAGSNGNAEFGEEKEGIPGPLLAVVVGLPIPGLCRIKNLQAQFNMESPLAGESGHWWEKVEMVKLKICKCGA